ncbi:adhesin [Gottfriedia acidiceleris]|uniref:Adhesin n=1 Tax=Gottfriedia acidiceleris TaxID=371036 RepID=A0ABY4JQN6_9BACI|nr:adhesin [Gottfriedia acidiceleris]UPM56149.1 adhesin [Gottfriedia acidiceleris]
MIITDKAKMFIENVMKQNNVDTLRFASNGEGCCGPSWGVELAPAESADVVQTINGLNVAIAPSIIEIVSDVTLDLQGEGEDAGLVIQGGSSCC